MKTKILLALMLELMTQAAMGYDFVKKIPEDFRREDVRGKYSKFDFSKNLIPQKKFLGFIGEDFQRMRITFTSIKQDPRNPDLYEVIGKSDVKKNICDFTGTITVKKIIEAKKLTLEVDAEKATHKNEGMLIATYEFKEDPKQKHAGFFSGVMHHRWVLTPQDKMVPNYLTEYWDGHCNNLFEGTWEAFDKKVKKIANWGEMRIPQAQEKGLDIGAGEFGVNPKYKANGWEMLYE